MQTDNNLPGFNCTKEACYLLSSEELRDLHHRSRASPNSQLVKLFDESMDLMKKKFYELNPKPKI